MEFISTGGIPLQKSPRSSETHQTSQAHETHLRRQLCAAGLKRQFDESLKGRRGKIASVLCQLPSLSAADSSESQQDTSEAEVCSAHKWPDLCVCGIRVRPPKKD